MSGTIKPKPLLKFALLGDAVASGFTGLLISAASGLLSNLLGMPQQLLLWVGLLLLPYAFVVGLVGMKVNIPVSAVWAIIIANAIWVFDSIALLLSGWVQPTTLGYLFVVGQALIVFAFADAQYVGMRKSHNPSQDVTA